MTKAYSEKILESTQEIASEKIHISKRNFCLFFATTLIIQAACVVNCAIKLLSHNCAAVKCHLKKNETNFKNSYIIWKQVALKQ